MSHLKDGGQNTMSKKDVRKYVFRVFLDFCAFQFFLHSIYSCAISTNSNNAVVWKDFSLFGVFLLGFYELIFLWYPLYQIFILNFQKKKIFIILKLKKKYCKIKF